MLRGSSSSFVSAVTGQPVLAAMQYPTTFFQHATLPSFGNIAKFDSDLSCSIRLELSQPQFTVLFA